MAQRFTDYYRAKGSYSRPGQAAKKMKGDKPENREVGTPELVQHLASLTPGQDATSTDQMEGFDMKLDLGKVKAKKTSGYRGHSKVGLKRHETDKNMKDKTDLKTTVGEDQEWDDDRMDIIGQNGNDGDHYDQVEELDEVSKDLARRYRSALSKKYDKVDRSNGVEISRSTDYGKDSKKRMAGKQRANAIINREEKEVSELNKSTLARYTRAAARDMVHQSIKGDSKKMQKRASGIDNATHKLAMRKEDLDEKTLTKAELKKREEIAKAMERDNPGMPMDKKMAIATAQAKKVAESTGEEQMSKELSELSKNTLGKYINRATANNTVASHYGGSQERRASDAMDKGNYNVSNKAQASADRMYRKSQKRQKGIEKAVNRLTKEDTQLDELKARTIGSYIGKATSNKERQQRSLASVQKHNADSMEYRGKVSTGMKSMEKVHKDIIKKREKGLAAADRALAKKESVEEAVTRQDVKQGIGIARDKRYAGGNMTGAVNAMDKLKKGLSSHPAVKKELQKQNEEGSPDRLAMIRTAAQKAQQRKREMEKKAERDAKRAMRGDKVLGKRPTDESVSLERFSSFIKK